MLGADSNGGCLETLAFNTNLILKGEFQALNKLAVEVGEAGIL